MRTWAQTEGWDEPKRGREASYSPPAPSGRSSNESKAAKSLANSMNVLDFDPGIFIFHLLTEAGPVLKARLFRAFLGMVTSLASMYDNNEVWPTGGPNDEFYNACARSALIRDLLQEVDNPPTAD